MSVDKLVTLLAAQGVDKTYDRVSRLWDQGWDSEKIFKAFA